MVIAHWGYVTFAHPLERKSALTHRAKTHPKLSLVVPAALLASLLIFGASAQAGEHRLGIGVEYWRTVDGLPSSGDFEDLEDDGNSWLLTYQYKPAGLFTFQLDAEYFPDGFGGSTESAIAPQAFILVGGGLYGGIGVGFTYSDGLEDDISDLFYMGRIGFNFSLLGTIKLDLHATYRFDDWDALKDISVSSDTYTFGAAVRFRI